MTWIVDASVAVKWVVPEVLSVQADRLLATGDDLLAPDLLLVEAANALWSKVTRGELSGVKARRALGLLRESGLDLRPTGPLLDRALALAQRLRHPVYDCVYLALAERERARFVTADARFVVRVKGRRLAARVVDLATLTR